MPRVFKTVTAVCACLLLAGCKFVPTADKQKQTSINSAEAPDKGFAAEVAAIWGNKVLPYVTGKAGSYPDVMAALKTNQDAAATKFGHRDKSANSPWTLLTKVEGKILAANTESRAAKLDVDVDNDGRIDLRIQIGPVIQGTAIRDSLDFVNFNSFTNQIDFAQFGKAFNVHINNTVLKNVPRDGLVGKSVTAVGAFPLAQGVDVPTLTPVTIEVR